MQRSTEFITSLVIMHLNGSASKSASSVGSMSSLSAVISLIVFPNALATIGAPLEPICRKCNFARYCLGQWVIFCESEHLVQIPILSVFESTLDLHDIQEKYDIRWCVYVVAEGLTALQCQFHRYLPLL